MKEQMGVLAGRQMNREEALLILNIEESKEEKELDPIEIMDRFETLVEKNQVSKGGSFYIQSKVYWAKQHLMQDHPNELNLSQWNPMGAGYKAREAKEEEEKKE